MLKIPTPLLGAFLTPLIVSLLFLLKAFCPEAAEGCWADQFALPIFLPLVMIYKIFGNSSVIFGQEFLFMFIYWSVIGALMGFIIDLFTHKKAALTLETASASAGSVTAIPTYFIKAEAPKPAAPAPKLPINLLDREEYK